MIRNRKRLAASLALLTALITPFVTLAPRATPARAATSGASSGLLRISDEGVNDLSSIDPPSPEAGDAQSNLVEGLIFAGLVHLDQNLHVQPEAAGSWTISADKKTYTFTL